MMYKLAVIAALLIIRSGSVPVQDREEETVYDQRQNGTENIHVRVDGVAIIYAPAESLVQVAAGSTNSDEIQELIEVLNFGTGGSGDKEKQPATTETPTETNTTAAPSSTTPTRSSATNTTTTQAPPKKTEKIPEKQNEKVPEKIKARGHLSDLVLSFFHRT